MARPLSTQALKLWPRKEGELEKKSPSALISWQRRYFVLSEGVVHYYKKKGDGKSLGDFDMGKASNLTVEGRIVKWKAEGEREVELKADTDATAQSWKAELEKTMEKAKETEALVQQLNDALLAREFQTLDDVIKRCKEAGVQGSDLNEGLTLLEKLRGEADREADAREVLEAEIKRCEEGKGRTEPLKVAIQQAKKYSSMLSGPGGKLVESGVEWQNKLEERDKILVPLSQQLKELATRIPPLKDRALLKQSLSDRIVKLQAMEVVHDDIEAASSLLKTWDAESGIVKELEDAVASKDVAKLTTAIKHAKDTSLKDSPEVHEAIKLRDSLESSAGALKQYEAALRDEIAKKGKAKPEWLQHCIDDCKRAKCDAKLIEQGEKLLESMQGQGALVDKLSDLLKACVANMPEHGSSQFHVVQSGLEDCVTKIEAIGAGLADADVQAAKKLMQRWKLEGQIIEQIDHAMKSKDVDEMTKAIETAKAAKVNTPEVTKAIDHLEKTMRSLTKVMSAWKHKSHAQAEDKKKPSGASEEQMKELKDMLAAQSEMLKEIMAQLRAVKDENDELKSRLKTACETGDFNKLMDSVGSVAGMDNMSELKAKIAQSCHPPGENEHLKALQKELDDIKADRSRDARDLDTAMNDGDLDQVIRISAKTAGSDESLATLRERLIPAKEKSSFDWPEWLNPDNCTLHSCCKAWLRRILQKAIDNRDIDYLFQDIIKATGVNETIPSLHKKLIHSEGGRSPGTKWEGSSRARETWLSESVFTQNGSSPKLSGVRRTPLHSPSKGRSDLMTRGDDGSLRRFTQSENNLGKDRGTKPEGHAFGMSHSIAAQELKPFAPRDTPGPNEYDVVTEGSFGTPNARSASPRGSDSAAFGMSRSTERFGIFVDNPAPGTGSYDPVDGLSISDKQSKKAQGIGSQPNGTFGSQPRFASKGDGGGKDPRRY